MQNLIEIIKRNKIQFICIGIIVISCISVVIQHFDRKNIIEINDNKLIGKENLIAVYITGQVLKPGVYYLKPDSRLENLIDLAGGLMQDADLNNVNLSKRLIDSDKIDIPKKEIKNVDENEKEEKINNIDSININEASVEELDTLDGIGELTAKRIIEYRKNQRFEIIEDIMNVEGIGQSKFNKIKDRICVK
ncbi:MAG: helix-hairpin-helix domain-containing protein [Clostridia bacterium]|nr:helix-hairpin-helix domain-containing protein [Clostridia bacterium]